MLRRKYEKEASFVVNIAKTHADGLSSQKGSTKGNINENSRFGIAQTQLFFSPLEVEREKEKHAAVFQPATLG